jgi:hypothetical protein
MGLVVFSVKPGFLRLAWLYVLNSCMTAILVWAFATSDGERRLRQTYVSKLQEQAFSGSRWVHAFASRKS